MKQRLVCLDPVLPIDSGAISSAVTSAGIPSLTAVSISVRADKVTFIRREGKKMLFLISQFYATLTNFDTTRFY